MYSSTSYVAEAAVELRNTRILIVEDDYLQATDYRTAFEAEDCIVIGPLSSEQAALELLREELPDVAIVDLNLGNGLSFNVARTLLDHRVPFVFATGYECRDIPQEFSTVPCLSKPIDPPNLVSALGATLHAA